MQWRMDAAGAVDAQNAPTAPWKTAENAVSHSPHTRSSADNQEERSPTSSTRSTHEIPDSPRNIAEGFLRFDPPEFAQFLKIAKGSIGETQNHLLHAKEQSYLTEEEFLELWRLTCRTLRAANRLHAYLRQCGRKKPHRGTTK
jgi:four helix bundle protein